MSVCDRIDVMGGFLTTIKMQFILILTVLSKSSPFLYIRIFYDYGDIKV